MNSIQEEFAMKCVVLLTILLKNFLPSAVPLSCSSHLPYILSKFLNSYLFLFNCCCWFQRIIIQTMSIFVCYTSALAPESVSINWSQSTWKPDHLFPDLSTAVAHVQLPWYLNYCSAQIPKCSFVILRKRELLFLSLVVSLNRSSILRGCGVVHPVTVRGEKSQYGQGNLLPPDVCDRHQ